MPTFQTVGRTLAIDLRALVAVTRTLVVVSRTLAVDFISGHPRWFPSPFAKPFILPCNPNFAKKLVNLSHALAIFQIANR
jgi:hypothetical protein